MITIGICDDDSIFSNTLYDIINRVMLSIDDWEPCIFHDKDEIIRTIDRGEFDCQLLFMDIMMQNGMGMQIAQHICNKQINTDIIFVTASKEHVFECYHYHAFAYLLKPISETDITNELQRYLKDLNYSPKYLPVSFMGVTHQVPISSIYYIESNRRKLTIYTSQGPYCCYQKLSDVEAVLKDFGFARCHQSYIVSLKKVTSFSNTQIIVNNTAIPVSSRYRSDIRSQFTSGTYEQIETELKKKASLNQLRKNHGAIICVQGEYLGSIVYIKPEEKILIGRDGSSVDMVVNLPFVSRNHCTLTYHSDTLEYEIIDYSSNGTFVNGGKRLLPDEPYILKTGSELSFGNMETIFKLG